jgi:hypothetical protein
MAVALWQDHTWIGTAFRPARSIDSYGRQVRSRWPGAAYTPVARGGLWRVGDRIVAEIRTRGGYPVWEAWCADPETGAKP